MVSAKVSSKGQVVIPRETRKAMGIEPGDLVDFSAPHEGHVHLVKLSDPWDDFFSAPKRKVKPGQMEKLLKERF